MKKEAWAVRFGRFFGDPLAKEIAKLPFKIHPNMVTLSSLIPGFLAAYCFFSNYLLFGVLFFIIAHVLDCTDGALARLTKQETFFGKKLDFYVDITRNALMYFGLWYGQFYLYGLWFIGGLIFFAHYCVMMFGYMFIQHELLFKSYYTSHDEGLITFMILPLLVMFNVDIFRIGLPILVSLQMILYLILFFRQKEKTNVFLNVKKILKLGRDGLSDKNMKYICGSCGYQLSNEDVRKYMGICPKCGRDSLVCYR